MLDEPEPPLPSETAPEELELLQPLKPAISSHTGGLPDMDMSTGGFVGERKKRVCGKCADCLVCKKKTEQTGE